MRITATLCVLALCAVWPLRAWAAPWAEVGNNQLRSDIELLAIAGLVDTSTLHWPLPWQSLRRRLAGAALENQPLAVQAAARRVLAAALDSQGEHAALTADVTNRTAVVYGFDGMGRGDGQAQLSLEQTSGRFSGRLNIGLITNNFGGKPNKLMLDGTYGAVNFAGLNFYAGYLTHWWGPGEISALQLSNNARPMPQIGFGRSSTARSAWPVLNLLGPWNFEFFVGRLDGPQKQSNVDYNAAHLTINPLPGLELGIAKTEEFCGQGHPCAPLRDYFKNIDFSTHPNNVNGEGSFEFKYSRAFLGVPFEVHMQLMDEDYALTTSSGTSHLYGLSLWLPMGGANPVKLTAEYTDSLATRTPFSYGNDIYGFTYTDYQYPDGMRYRGRTLGFSLDTDSTLLSLQANWSDDENRFYEISLHHAAIGNARSTGVNIVSPAPVKLNLAQARVSLPLRLGGQGLSLDLEGRVQDDQPRPSSGFAVAIEAALRIGL